MDTICAETHLRNITPNLVGCDANLQSEPILHSTIVHLPEGRRCGSSCVRYFLLDDYKTLSRTYTIHPMPRIDRPSEVVTLQQLRRCRRSFQGWPTPVWHACRWPLNTTSKTFLDEFQRAQHS